MVELSEISYKVTVVKYEVTDHASYLIKIIGPRNINFHIRDRYSKLREWFAHVKG